MEIPKIDTGFDDDEATTKTSAARRSLSDFSPKVNLKEEDIQQGLAIRRPNASEAFCKTGDEIDVACVLDRHHDAHGNYQGETFHPVSGELQHQVSKHLRLVRFIGCLSASGGHFVLPQKLNTRQLSNSWNSSLADSLAQEPGVFIKLTSNAADQRYDYTVADITCEGPLAIPDFEAELLKALDEHIIDSPDHPVFRKFVTAA